MPRRDYPRVAAWSDDDPQTSGLMPFPRKIELRSRRGILSIDDGQLAVRTRNTAYANRTACGALPADHQLLSIWLLAPEDTHGIPRRQRLERHISNVLISLGGPHGEVSPVARVRAGAVDRIGHFGIGGCGRRCRLHGGGGGPKRRCSR